ncbi:fatty acid desaturase [Paenibacillus chartarius]|uniref:Fatty acid desaturase n=1 Tax=Paenibacillus chartarius TaxID=747481 RepID=A0ABV6DTB6_9BACL
MSDSRIKHLKHSMTPYEKTNVKASVMQIANTIVPFIGLWYVAYLLLDVSYVLTFLVAVVAACFNVRTFILFHDCCHQSFFRSRLANGILGTITGILTLVPYEQWKWSHTIHHATSGNLDKRGTGDMWVMTVEEYAEAPLLRRIAYRLYRHPLVLFGLGPVAVFLIQYRFNRKQARRKERMNTYLTNLGIVLLYAGLCALIGWKAFVLVQAPIFYISGLLGFWLFYVQHQFEDSYFENEDEWSYVQAAVEGSSYYKLPAVLQWLTGNIGFHHVHHLSPKIPNYNLELAHESVPSLQKATTITVKSSLKSLRFRLWDEQTKTFVTFKEGMRLSRTRRKENATSCNSGIKFHAKIPG